MKRILSGFVVVVLALSMAVPSFAADLGSTSFFPQVSGKSTEVSKTVKTKTGTHRVSGYSYRSQAQQVFKYLNNERRAHGLEALAWEEDLYEPAIQRALEQYVLWSHTRPDGSDCFTVHELVNGENLAAGDIDAYDVMYGIVPGEGWMNSPDHRTNILDPDYNSVAVACVETDKMTYWVQLFHSDKKITKAEAAQGRTSSSSSTKVKAKDVTDKLAAGKAATIKNAEAVSPSVIKDLAAWGTKNGRSATFTVTTTREGKNTIQGRMTVNPANFTARKNDLLLSVYTEGNAVEKTAANFDKWYTNNVAVVKLAQEGSLGGTVRVAARLDISKLDAKTLRFYAYDGKKVALLKETDYEVDEKYVRFNTNRGGYIIVTDKKLSK